MNGWSPLHTQEATAYVVETHDLTKWFRAPQALFSRAAAGNRHVLAVDCVNIRLSRGEIFGLVGPNGAGKTTLIKILSTLLLPTAGTARVGRFDVVKAGHRVRQLVGLVTSNERSFYWRLTGRQNMAFFADLYHIPQPEGRAWMEELFDLLGLRDSADKRFDTYSTGQRQRLAMARGLLSKPQVLFMDEPTKGVDPTGAAEIVTIIRERIVKLWHPTILVTSHNLSEIERLCGRIAVMDHGSIIAVGELDALRTLARAADTYRLKLRALSEQTLRTITAAAGALQPIQYACCNGAIDLQVNFQRGGAGFPRMIRAIVEQGGEVLTCSAVAVSFDDVFHTLISQHTLSHSKAN